MKRMSNNETIDRWVKLFEGMTIIEIMIVVIILILLAVIAIFNANKPMEMAKAMSIKEEFGALYTGLSNMQTLYNLGLIEYTSGEHYSGSFEDENHDVWYIVYGLDNASKDPYENKYNQHVIDTLGLDELKRSYEFRLRNYSEDKDEIVIRFLNNEYVEVNGYRVRTYDDIIDLIDKGAF